MHVAPACWENFITFSDFTWSVKVLNCILSLQHKISQGKTLISEAYMKIWWAKLWSYVGFIGETLMTNGWLFVKFVKGFYCQNLGYIYGIK